MHAASSYSTGLFAFILSSMFSAPTSAQDFIMSNASWNACSGNFHDSGGANGNYSGNQNFIATLCPGSGPGVGATVVAFSGFQVGSALAPGDQLVIHNGVSTSAPVLAVGNNTNSLVGQTFTATSLSGCLTFHWTSTLLGGAPGWTASILSGPDAGINGSLTICSGQDPFPLADVLGGEPDVGGVWNGPLGAHGPIYDPDTDPGGVYNYVVVDGSQCVDSATVAITNLPSPDAGDDGGLLICASSGPVPLFSNLNGTPDAGGTWTGPEGAHSGTFDPASDPSGTYAYSLPSAPPCPNASASVVVALTGAPDAGSDGQVVLCDTLTAFPLITGLVGAPQVGGAWQDLSGTGALDNGLLSTAGLAGGTYIFRYIVQVIGCGSDTSMVQIRVIAGLEVTGLVRSCEEDAGTSVIRFTIAQGSETAYSVLGVPGTIATEAPFLFVSDALPDSVAYTIVVIDPNGCGSLSLVIPPCYYEPRVLVPQFFSPNSDGVNEAFLIPGLEDFPGNELYIFDRWGGQVHHAVDYPRSGLAWDGSSADGPLPSGTYFYVLELGNGADSRRGLVQLKR